jgi:ribose 5-phosphate isomerase B
MKREISHVLIIEKGKTMGGIAIGADHRGYALKEYIKKTYQLDKSLSWVDVGTYSSDRTDYPLFAKKLADLMNEGAVTEGILICGSGVGMTIAANRYKKIYAALAWNEEVARLSKEHDKANVLVVPADFISYDQAIAMIIAWQHASFNHDDHRYQKRIDMIDTEKN